MAKLYFYYAAMNAGKSTTLLQADYNYRERGMETMLWTAAHDDRVGQRHDRFAHRFVGAGPHLSMRGRPVRRDRRGTEEARARLHPRSTRRSS